MMLSLSGHDSLQGASWPFCMQVDSLFFRVCNMGGYNYDLAIGCT